MAQFRTTADLLDLALSDAGEITNGNSPYETDALAYLNEVHMAIVSGGTIPIGKDSTVEIDETWPWAKSRRPLVLELQAKIETGTVSLTLSSEAGTFSSAPSVSVAGWYLRIPGRTGLFRIASHTAAATAFELDAAYPDTTGATLTYEVFKLDYDLTPDYLVIDSTNNKVEFQETAGTTLTATLTSGSYTPSALATEVQTQMNTTGGTPVYTVTYSAITKKFTLASDRGGSSVFILVGTGSNSAQSAHRLLGFDDENTTNAASITSTYILGGIARLVEPIKIHGGGDWRITAIDPESFTRDYPFADIEEGYPDRFCVLSEAADGSFRLRFNRYPTDKTRIEIEYVEVPRDLKDNSSSIPLLPRKHVSVLKDAVVSYLYYRKNDDRLATAVNIMQGKLRAMISQHRGAQVRAGEHFGQIISRRDNVRRKRLLFSGDPY